MNWQDVIDVIERERLDHYSLIDEPNRPHSVALSTAGQGNWVTFLTDDRAAPIASSAREFSDQDRAFNDFVDRLRRHNELADLEARIRGSRGKV